MIDHNNNQNIDTSMKFIDDTIEFDNPNKLTELPSIYFKPCAAVEATPGTVQENRGENEASYRVSLTESKHMQFFVFFFDQTIKNE